MTTDNTRTVNKLLDVIQSTLHGFAADYAGSGPGDVFAAQQEVAEVRRLFAQQEHEIVLLSAKMRSVSAISQGAMDRTDLARAEIERLHGLLDAMGIQIAVMAAAYGDVRAEPEVMERVRAFCEPYRDAILDAARDGSELVGLNVPLRLAMPAAGGEE